MRERTNMTKHPRSTGGWSRVGGRGQGDGWGPSESPSGHRLLLGCQWLSSR